MIELCAKSGNALFQALQNVVLFVGNDGLIHAINPYGLDLLGFKEEQLIGQHVGMVLLAADAHTKELSSDIYQSLISDQRHFIPITVQGAFDYSFNSQISIGPALEVVDGVLRRVFSIKDSGELDARARKQDEQRQQLEVALGAIPDGFAIYDQDDRLELYNRAYQDIYSKSADRIEIGIKFEDVIKEGLAKGQYIEAGTTPQEQANWLAERMKAHENPQGPIIQRLGDSWIKIDERKLPDGRTAGIRTDISQFVENKTIAESLGDILDNLAVAIVFTSPKTRKFVYANKAAIQKLGYSATEILQIGPEQIIADDSVQDIESNWQKLFENQGDVAAFKSIHRRKDGSTYPCLVRSMSEPGENPKRVVTLIHDETEEEKIRAELEFQRIEREAIFENLPACMTHSQLDTTMLYSNEAYADFLGINRDDLIGMKFLDLVPEDIRPRVQNNLRKLTADNPIQSFEQNMVSTQGKARTFLWTNRLIVKDGEPSSIISIGRDITEVKRTHARIEQQAHDLRLRNHALEQYAGIVSHDLRSPLRHVRMFGEILLDEFTAGKTDNIDKYIGKMRNSALRLDLMVTSLLEFSQVAYKEVNHSTFMLSKAFGEAVDNLQENISLANARVTLGSDIELTLDFMLVVRLLQNLIDNSIKYSKASKKPIIRVDAECQGNQIEITVQDNGIGIPQEHADRIFNIFQRLHKDTKTYSGTGIGLALAKRIVEGHNGQICVDNSYLDGTRIVIRFPFSNTSTDL